MTELNHARPLWLSGDSETAALIAEFDWASTPLGPITDWSQALRSGVDTIVNSPIPKVMLWGADHRMIYNDAYREILGGYHPGALGGQVAVVLSEVWDFNSRVLDAGLRGQAQTYRNQPMSLLRHGEVEELVFDLFYTPIRETDGSVGGVLCTVLETTTLVQTQRDLKRSNERFAAAVGAVHGVLWTNTPDGRMEGEQPGWAKLTGQSPAEYQGLGWAEAVHPDDRGASVATWQDAVASKSTFVHEHRVRRADGTWCHFAIRAVPIFDEQGAIREWVGIHTDITAQRLAETALVRHAEDLQRQIRHRERAEEQLRTLNETLEARIIAAVDERRQAQVALAQAQKMESIGKLTGGIAHDFNNLLQVVSGNLQLLATDVMNNERAERRVSNAMAGVARGAKLAAQLLAFGRRQALEPRVVNVTRFVRNMDDMLHRALGEGIEIETIAGGSLWNTFIDPTQIENALLNLAINARDAMDGQGKLTIELGNASLDETYARSHEEVEAGQYVMLAVTDTGCGMTPEVLARVFEPFFSTKGEGKGSGLGLSMVYGFVKQSGGHIKIYSEVGHGTTIRLYLPRALESEDVEVVAVNEPVKGGTETVLVVEDDEDVRNTVVELLTELGYSVLRAVDAQSGLTVIESGIKIDLLFTDVVMPGTLKSPELARKAKERLPDLAVLFTSGYTENSIVHGGRLDAGVELISKPYTREALARKVRHVLANEAQRRKGAAPKAPVTPPAAAPTAARTHGIMLVEDDALIRMSTADLLEDMGHTVCAAASAEEALMMLQGRTVEVLVTDLNLPRMSGLQLIEQVLEAHPDMAIVLATGDSAIECNHATRLEKPYGQAELSAAIAQAVARVRQVAPVRG
ncbi:response regulator [Falsirhodobacter sp. 1013]|uniref:hybrid sensor histidine kinase/response regulator n=1 Tax=Falsirhodobacter sp. 1013 TaxID=3417566 RepID=UPI003EB93DF2